MIHRMDPPADPALEPMPEQIEPMLARAGSLPRDDERLGVRDQVGRRARDRLLAARAACAWRAATCNDITASYPELARLGRALGSHRAILDGEIVAFDERRPAELRRACSGACTSARRARPRGSPRASRSPT